MTAGAARCVQDAFGSQPRFDEQDASRRHVCRHAGDALVELLLVGDVADGGEEARHHVEGLTDVEGAVVGDVQRGPVTEPLRSDGEHRRRQVGPDDVWHLLGEGGQVLASATRPVQQ